MIIQHKSFSFEVKNVDERESKFQGYSAGIGNEDLGRDIIEPGAFTKTIKERVKSRNVKLLDNHSKSSTKNVWGTVVDAEEIEVEQNSPEDPTHKLWTDFEVSKKDKDAQTALAKVEEGHLNQLSIGYRPIKADYTIDDDSSEKEDPFYAWLIGEATRHIKELAWWETSLVIWGMNPEATIVENSVKTIQHFAQIARKNKENIPQRYVEAAVKAMNSLIDLDINYDQIENVKNVVANLEQYTKNLEKVEQSIFTQLINEYKSSQDTPSREHFLMWVATNTNKATFEEQEEVVAEKKDMPETETSGEAEKESENSEDSDNLDLRVIADRLNELSVAVEALQGTNREAEDANEEAAAESTLNEAAESTSEDTVSEEKEDESEDIEALKVALELADMELKFN